MGQRQRRLAKSGVPIFTYHKIARKLPVTRDPFLYVSPDQFDAQLAKLRQQGFTSVSLADMPPGMSHSARPAVITFDDGCRSVLEHGAPILARHNFRAVQFLVAGSIGGRNEWDIAKGDAAEALMDEVQVREWLQAGHEIGSHSLTHVNLRHARPQQLREEIVASKKQLEDRFGVEVQHFCYPFGAWNPEVRDCVREAGYRTACTVLFGVNDAGTPRFELRRIIPLSSTEMLRKILHRVRRRMAGGG